MKKGIGLFVLLTLLLTGTVIAGNADNDLILRISSFKPVQYQMALDDLVGRFPDRFEVDETTLVALQKIKQQREILLERMKNGDRNAFGESMALLDQLDGQLLKNPLLAGKSLIVLKRSLGVKSRSAMGGELGLAPSNFQNNSEIRNPAKDWENEFVQISFKEGKKKVNSFYKPAKGIIISDPEMHFSGTRMLFSSIGTNGRWHIFEIDLTTRIVKQITPETYKDFDSFDACYTPDDRIIFCSTATFMGLPCTDGGNKMSGIFLFDPKTGKTRQLTFDQDSNWGPVVMNNGQILYQRWEYVYFNQEVPHLSIEKYTT